MKTVNLPLKSFTAAAEKLGMRDVDFFRAAGIGRSSFYKVDRRGTISPLILEKTNAFLKTKGVAPIVPVSDTPDVPVEPAEPEPVAAPARARGRNVEMVPSGFIPHALQTLGISVVELARLSGVSIQTIYNWNNKGSCPLSFRAAVNGLLAEHAAGGTRQLGSVPEKQTKRRYVNGRFTLLVEEVDMSAAVSLLATHGIRVTVTKE